MTEEKIHVETSFSSLIKKNEELCGDKVAIRYCDQFCILVLADGLGSGVKANILSTLTSTIICEMMAEGSTLQEAVDTITATLPQCQERGIAYSTFTIVQIYYDGTAYLIEFDNPAAIIMRRGQCLELPRTTRMIGGRKIRESSFQVEPNDFIVVFSDGIIHAGVGTFLNFGWDHADVEKHLTEYCRSTDPAREVTRILLACVNDLYQGKPGDDSTVATAKIVPAAEARVRVGPPEHPEDDRKVVGRLLSATGKKICCGGTTSNIVARITGKEIQIENLLSLTSDVPPMAYIEGLDLVTEGVLTLQKANEYLHECAQSPQFYEQFLLTKQEDGAILLTKMFLQDCTKIVFMVGRSDNPAHRQLAYSTISLRAKIRMIERMAENLKKLGKIVQIELY